LYSALFSDVRLQPIDNALPFLAGQLVPIGRQSICSRREQYGRRARDPRP
jgi:hypothetical protein